MKKFVVLVVMVMVSVWTVSAFAGEVKMIGTVQAIKMHGNGAEMILKDRKSEANFLLQARDNSTMDKLRDHKIRLGDELRVRFDSGSKLIIWVRKTAGC